MNASPTSPQVRPFGHALCEALNLQHIARIEFSPGPNPFGALAAMFVACVQSADAIVETIKRYDLVERVDAPVPEPVGQGTSVAREGA